MTDAPPTDALDRIDSALARIEAAASRYRDLLSASEARNDALRTRVAEAIATLDALILAEEA
ncbi:hypothetical protein SAMN06297144_2916 [Sphingomonas guangdongensis]|uniref:Uncharacterized protein n=1 Tax=Sphingomonas guangdongensis TaxID=1141890 RepID=A0A285R236_9SPHN|nr:hypothetical protein [Sphingomonas guangdongensis]SOB87779.1 hypothetical protein SAMN06297144_2916 [Sphingomonas guangdongensis]